MPDRSHDIAIAKRLGWTDIHPEVHHGKPTGEYEGRCDNQVERLPEFSKILMTDRLDMQDGAIHRPAGVFPVLAWWNYSDGRPLGATERE